MAGIREVVAGMGDELRPFRDERGRALVDLPDAPRPSPDVEVPVRLLGHFDNLLLGYHDRTRTMTDEARARVCHEEDVKPSVLVDGMVVGLWDDELVGDAAVATVSPFRPLIPAARDGVEAQAHAALRFAHPDAATTDVRLLPPG